MLLRSAPPWSLPPLPRSVMVVTWGLSVLILPPLPALLSSPSRFLYLFTYLLFVWFSNFIFEPPLEEFF